MKKFIVLLTILSMLVGMLPTVSFAASSYEPIKASAEKFLGSAKLVDSFQYEINSDGNELIQMYTSASKTTKTNRGIVYYKFKLPDIAPGETVTKANLNLRYGSWKISSATASEYQFRFYLVNTPWNDNIEWENQPVSMNDSAWPVAEPDASHDLIRQKEVADMTVDISSMVRSYLASGSTEDFSLAIMPYQSASNGYTYLWPRTATTNYPTITLETDVVSALDTTSITPAAASDDDVVFEFNNPIDESSVSASDFSVTDIAGNSVEVADGDFTVSGNTVTLSKTWDNYGFYQVSLSGISDVYGQALSGSRSTSFEITASTTPAIAGVLDSFSINNNGTVTSFTSATNKDFAQSGYMLYKFNLSGIDTSKAIVSANLKWTNYGKNEQTIVGKVVPNGTWTNLETLSDALASDNYYAKVDEAYKSGAATIATLDWDFTPSGTSYSRKAFTVDVSTAVSKILLDDTITDKYITFAFAANGTRRFYSNATSTSSRRPSLTLNLASPSFDALEAAPVKGGTMTGVNDPINLTLATSINKAYANTEYIKLIKISDNSEVGISIAVSGSKLTVTPVAGLDERSEYKLVLKSGIKDTFEKGLDSDKVIHRFTSGTKS